LVIEFFKLLIATYMCFFKYCLSVFLFCVCGMLTAQPALESRAEELLRYQMTEVRLKNGLRVCLKRSYLEPEEFDFQLFAIGGLGHLPAAAQPSAWLASEIAWESGLDQMTADELECALDDHSVEMNVKLDLFDRQIKATGPTSELAYCLHLTKLLFTDPQFNEVGLQKALTQARQRFQRQEQANKVADEQTALKINLRNWYTITPFNSLDLGKVELQKAKELFKTFFSNPAEFMLIIVGDFDHQEVIALLEESLGSLPSSPVVQWSQPTPPSFPEGVTKKEFAGITRYRYSLTRLTFPLSTSIRDPMTLDLLCFILRQELTSESTPEELKKAYLNVSYSFPLFPYLEPCWLVIKFTSHADEIQSLSQGILAKMEKIQQQGTTEKAVKMAFQELAKNRTQMSDNAYILSLLADCYHAGWDVSHLYVLPNQDQQEKELLKKAIDCYPNLNQYSIISLHP
jgi:zinc protease